MRVLLTGATGLIGSATLARLAQQGHEVIAISRRRPRISPVAAVRWVSLDMNSATQPSDWLPHLEGVDAVVNCAGVLQDGVSDSTSAIHVRAPAALFAACEQSGVRRVIQISAVGVDRLQPTAFSQTKAQGDADLMARNLDWVVLRPSVVLGRAAYGGSALFRALAALPVIPMIPNAGQLQVVQLDDLVSAILHFLKPDAPSRVQLEIAGPERLSFNDVVAAYRHWLGWRPARQIRVPAWVPRGVFRFGDVAGRLGWRCPIRSTARLELERGAVGDPAPWMNLTGIKPRALRAALEAEPASVQERWFALLYLLKPFVWIVLSLFWIATALISLGPGREQAFHLLQQAQLTGQGATAALVAGALTDLAIGIGIAFRRTARAALLAALAGSAGYLIVGTALVPHLWSDPLGALVKIFPILALHLIALAIVEDR